MNKENMIFPKDILEKIKSDFKSEINEDVVKVLSKSVEAGLNVGNWQFIRSLLFLSNGNIEKMKKEISECNDPRDIVMEAEIKSGNFGHYFIPTFDEIAKVKASFFKE